MKGNSPWGSIAQQRNVQIYVYIYIYTHVLLKSDLRRLYILTSFPHVDRQLICVRGGRVGLRSDLRGFVSVVFIAVKFYNIFHQQLES